MTFKNLTRLFFVILTVALVTFGPLYGNRKASALFSADRYVATTGSDAGNDCSIMGSPCATIQHAVDQSLSGDTIHVAAGTYPVAGLVTIDKTLTLLGAQAGVDAHLPIPRVGPESIISNSQGTIVAASNVVIDGFTIQDSTNQAYTSYGILLNSGLLTPGFNGTQILNNILQNNVAGLGLANEGPAQAIIKRNLFKNNNPGNGSAFGTGIYTDQFVGGKVSHVLIDSNRFVNENNAGIGFSSQDLVNQDSDITITNNVIDSCGRGIYFYNTGSSTVTDNTITNATVPTDGGTSVGIGIFGAVNDLSILRNNIETGAKRGIRIGSFTEPLVSNVNVTIHLNNIFGFAEAGLFVDDPALTGPADFATCNYWGCSCGPTNPANPAGTGDVVSGNVVLGNFNPWLLGLAPDAQCGASPAGTVTACKYYDTNANGVFDGSDLPLKDWPITINPLGAATPNQATLLTDVTGCVSWANVETGPHTISEGTPAQSNWIHSTPGSVSITVVLGANQVSFGNYCKVSSGGLTLGFWSNKNGQAILKANDPAWRTLLNGCCLRNADGSIYQVPGGNFASAYASFRNWLLGANAKNMANMLSAQLAAMKLNVAFGSVNGNAFDLCSNKTINDLTIAAKTSLCANGSTPSGDPNRAAQETLKNCLDALNNGGLVVSPTPCAATFPN